MKIGIIGVGIVGSAILQDFIEKDIEVITYDKYKNGGIGDINKTLECEFVFLCWPTPYCNINKQYNKQAIYEICEFYSINKFKGLLVLKSTVEPTVTENISCNYNLNIIHSPEFLTARTACEDIKGQTHIVLGKTTNLNTNLYNDLIRFLKSNYPIADISLITSTESELMKLGVNSFYATKIQFFNELYCLSKKLGISFNTVRDVMLKNKWINPMHTKVPGTDGKLSYGGMCFPKDTNALNQFMIKNNSYNMVLNSTIEECNKIRHKNNIIEKSLEI